MKNLISNSLKYVLKNPKNLTNFPWNKPWFHGNEFWWRHHITQILSENVPNRKLTCEKEISVKSLTKLKILKKIFEKKHSIRSEGRPEIMIGFKKILYEDDENIFCQSFDDFLCQEKVARNPKFVSYLTSLYEVRTHWAHCYRNDLRTRDTILKRTKEVNINGLFEKLTCEFNEH